MGTVLSAFGEFYKSLSGQKSFGSETLLIDCDSFVKITWMGLYHHRHQQQQQLW
jgi:hypothetical protein